MRIPSDKLHHITVVVHNAHDAAVKMARMYGIRHWNVIDASDKHLSDRTTRGFAQPFSFRSATGTVETSTGPVTFELVQPLEGWSIYQEWLTTRGEGIFGMAIAEISDAELVALRPWLDQQSVTIAQSFVLDKLVKRVHLDTRDTLGGFYVELLVLPEPDWQHVKGMTDWRGGRNADQVWDLAAEVEGENGLLPLNGFMHFGVVVKDLMQTVAAWNRLFGEKDFLFMNWHNGPDSLVDPENNGVPVEHAYFTTTPTIGERLTYELIQPTFGPSHYKEDFLQPLGPGIHHIWAGFLPSKDAWETVKRDMAAVQVPVCMGAGLGDEIGHFGYLDTRQALPGYVTELVWPGDKPSPPEAGFPFTPLMTIKLGSEENSLASVDA